MKISNVTRGALHNKKIISVLSSLHSQLSHQNPYKNYVEQTNLCFVPLLCSNRECKYFPKDSIRKDGDEYELVGGRGISVYSLMEKYNFLKLVPYRLFKGYEEDKVNYYAGIRVSCRIGVKSKTSTSVLGRIVAETITKHTNERLLDSDFIQVLAIDVSKVVNFDTFKASITDLILNYYAKKDEYCCNFGEDDREGLEGLIKLMQNFITNKIKYYTKNKVVFDFLSGEAGVTNLLSILDSSLGKLGSGEADSIFMHLGYMCFLGFEIKDASAMSMIHILDDAMNFDWGAVIGIIEDTILMFMIEDP